MTFGRGVEPRVEGPARARPPSSWRKYLWLRPLVPRAPSAFPVLEFGVEEPQAVREPVLVGDAVEMLEEKRQRLALVEPGLGGEAAEAAEAVLGHGDVDAAGEAEALGHQKLAASRVMTGSAPERMRARCNAVAGSWRAM